MTTKGTYFAGRPVAFNVMSKPIGPVCNLHCAYCYYLEKKNLYQKVKNFRMKEDVLEHFTKQYIDAQEVPVVTFVWQGGEPTLLGVDYFRKAVEFQKRYAGNKRIENSFQTNGTLLNDEWCRFFANNNFLVGISIDGPKELHDPYRTGRSGEPSWEEVMRGVRLLKKHRVEFNTLSVVNDLNVNYPLDVYHFLKNIGSGFIQFIPIVERIADQPKDDDCNLVTPSFGEHARVAEWSVDPRKYGDFLIKIFDEWVRQDVGKYFVQMFDATLANWVGEMAGLCVFNETCGHAMALEHNGDLYSCDHFVYKDYYLGNILETPLKKLALLEKQMKFGYDKRNSLPRFCQECEYRFACHGECPKNRISLTPDGEKGLNYLCPAFKKFFAHVHPYMQYMGDQLEKKQSPANVMNWVRYLDGKKQQKVHATVQMPGKAGRNDPCPCGSGKKYKNCCMKKMN